MNIVSAYKGTKRVSIDFYDEDGNHDGRTEQSHKDDVKVQNIIKRYDKTGLITHVRKSAGQYGDYTETNEYQESMNLVVKANEAFEELPSDIRRRFGNDPGAFFEFVTNPENNEALVEMGLAEEVPKVVETIQKVEVVNTTETDSAAEK